MKNIFSPRQLAEVIGVSESSLKRWADDGLLHVTRTVGGHRRIPRSEAVRFIRERKLPVLDPAALGFYAPVRTDQIDQEPADALFQALHDGRREQSLGLVEGWFLEGRSVAWIADGPVVEAMRRLGELWKRGPEGILCEHRATDLCVQAVIQLRLALPKPPEDAPVAVGAAPSGDPYLLPTLLAAGVCQEAGLRAVNFGPETPLPVLAAAADEHDASLVWLSISTDEGAGAAGAGVADLAAAVAARGGHLIVGGRRASGLDAAAGTHVTMGSRLTELAALARGVAVGRDGTRGGSDLDTA